VRSLPVARRYPVTYLRSAVDGRRLREDFAAVRSFVIFVGYPRSGHSLVGALLDAHPNVLVAHELDVLKYAALGYSREQLFALLVRNEQARVAGGHVSSTGYGYAVPGQWQGGYQRLEVIGDKKGGRSTIQLGRDPGLLDLLGTRVEVPLRIVHVVRNPHDVIATMFRRRKDRTLAQQVDAFFGLAGTVEVVRRRRDPSLFHEIHLEDLIADPPTALRGLCTFVSVPAEDGYLEACGRIVFPSPRRTRDAAPWTPDVLSEVAARAARHPSLAGYRFDEAATADEAAS
jgi:hypothetical protein